MPNHFHGILQIVDVGASLVGAQNIAQNNAQNIAQLHCKESRKLEYRQIEIIIPQNFSVNHELSRFSYIWKKI
jgi:hypothetical protein